MSGRVRRTSACRTRSVELRGRATIEDDVGRAFDIGVSWKYDGRDLDPDPPGAVRLIVRMTVDKGTGYAA
jgi:hypothetical protein